MPRISILIPLYRSSRFQDVIAENIRALSDPDVEVILSDRNGDDSIAKALRADGLLSDRVKFNVSSDNRDWVDNINALIESASGDYFRILPMMTAPIWPPPWLWSSVWKRNRKPCLPMAGSQGWTNKETQCRSATMARH